MSNPPHKPTTTLVYSKVDGLEIKFDLYLPPNAAGALPTLVCFHGGGFVMGDREQIAWEIFEQAIKHGMAFISPDYRLLDPNTGFDELEDVQALFHFISKDINEHLPEGITIDTSRIAVQGVSAGGYLARLAALYVKPQPRAVFSLYGVGGDWFSDQYVSVKTAPLKFAKKMITKEDVKSLEHPKPVAEDPMMLDSKGAPTGDDLQHRSILMLWFLQNGTFIDYLVGEAGFSERRLRSIPAAEREAAIPQHMTKLFPQLHIDANFPPTVLVHGDSDSVVLKHESEHMHAQLQKVGVRTELHIVPGAEHGLKVDGKLAPDAPRCYQAAFDFLWKELA